MASSQTSTRPSLLWRLLATNALVLLVAALLLIVTPVTISTNIVLAEVLIVFAGLLVMLAADLVLLRRTLAPLRALTSSMGTVDPGTPSSWPPVAPRQDAEVAALAEAFEAMLVRLESERRRSARRALAAQEDERLRIARELHDEIGQTLTAVTIQAERAAQMDDPVDRRLLAQIAETALHSLDDVRRIARELRPEALDDLGLVNALITLCTRISTQSGIRIERQLEGGLPPLAPEIELVIYRIAQEAITNAVRHAEPTTIEVSLTSIPGAVLMRVRDDGVGFAEPLPTGTVGVSGMRERALLVDAQLEIRSQPGRGTEIELEIAVPRPPG